MLTVGRLIGARNLRVELPTVVISEYDIETSGAGCLCLMFCGIAVFLMMMMIKFMCLGSVVILSWVGYVLVFMSVFWCVVNFWSFDSLILLMCRLGIRVKFYVVWLNERDLYIVILRL